MEKKLRIHYIWIKEYKCFHNQSFNFSTQYRFTYDPKTQELKLAEKSTGYIDDFFGDNIDLTAIVGKNGTGKTNLLRFILGLRNDDLIETECVIVCEYNGKFCAAEYYRKNDNTFSHRPIQIAGCENADYFLVIEYLNVLNNEQRFFGGEKIRFVYLTEMFNMSQYGSSLSGGDDLSFASVMYDQTINGDEEKHVKSPVLRYIHRITDWQIDFLSNGREFTKEFNINFPPFIFVDPTYDPNAFSKLYVKVIGNREESNDTPWDSQLNSDARRYLHRFLNRGTSAECLSLKDEYAQAIFMNIITSVDYVAETGNGKEKALFEMIDQVNDNSKAESAWDIVYELLIRIRENNAEYIDSMNNRAKSSDEKTEYVYVEPDGYIAFMNYLSSEIFSQDEWCKPHPVRMTINIPTDDEMEKVRTLFNKYKESVSIVDFLSFSWGLSSGETLLLNQFGKLTHLLKKDEESRYFLPKDVNSDETAENAVIMLDEAEVAFHPEWQRKYLDAFLKFVKNNMSDQGTHVQIILATH